MNVRSRLTYANVAATLALVLAVGGGTVYAALELGRNDVKSRNIAKGAVKTSDLGRNAVTGPKMKDGAITGADMQDGSITGADIAAGVIPALDADVAGSSTGGPQGGINTDTSSALPLSGTTSFTPRAGDVSAIAAEAQFTVASTSAAEFCDPAVVVFVNGQPTRVFASPEINVNSLTPVQAFGRDAAGPYGLLNPGTPLTITAELLGDADCTADSQLDKVEVSIVQIS
jgi:hypothetical protein